MKRISNDRTMFDVGHGLLEDSLIRPKDLDKLVDEGLFTKDENVITKVFVEKDGEMIQENRICTIYTSKGGMLIVESE